jgi:hypothetical protein
VPVVLPLRHSGLGCQFKIRSSQISRAALHVASQVAPHVAHLRCGSSLKCLLWHQETAAIITVMLNTINPVANKLFYLDFHPSVVVICWRCQCLAMIGIFPYIYSTFSQNIQMWPILYISWWLLVLPNEYPNWTERNFPTSPNLRCFRIYLQPYFLLNQHTII